MALTKVSYSMIQGECINVLDYGADPTGVADSTNAINAALTAASGTAKKTVFVPSGSYITTNTIVIPNYVSLVAENNGWMTDTYTYGGGVVFFKNHNNNGISSTGNGSNNAIGGKIQGICVVNGASYTTGSGIYIDGVHQQIVQDCTVSRIGGTASAFQFGFTDVANYTTYVTATNCYSNSTGTGTAFGVNGKWFRILNCISDGGAYGFYLGAQVQEGSFTNIHTETTSIAGIYLTGAGRNSFVTGYVATNSAVGSSGIVLANTTATFFNKFINMHVLGDNAANQVGVVNTGGNNTFNTLQNCTIENFDTGYQDGGENNSVVGSLFYNCKFPMAMGGNRSTLTENTTQNTVAAGGTWAINHTGGTVGNWTRNYLDGSNANGVINPGVTGVVGDFSGIKVRDNAGFVSRNQGQTTGTITSGTTISHGLAGTPAAGGIYITPYINGVTSQAAVSSPNATTFTVTWNSGTANVQFGWSANLACDN